MKKKEEISPPPPSKDVPPTAGFSSNATDKSRHLQEAANKTSLLANQGPVTPLQDPIKPLETQFHQTHTALFTQERRGFFGVLRKTSVKSNWDLSQIIQHAKNENNRSRRACISLGWLDKDGRLSVDAPKEVQDTYNKCIEPPTPKCF